MFSTSMRLSWCALVAITGWAVAGCGGAGTKGPEGRNAVSPAADACAVEGWCTEHGVPEEICAQCNAKVAADYQRKGDWCKEHNRPESQCFLCTPKLAAKFVAEYEAKHGKKPPQPEAK